MPGFRSLFPLFRLRTGPLFPFELPNRFYGLLALVPEGFLGHAVGLGIEKGLKFLTLKSFFGIFIE